MLENLLPVVQFKDLVFIFGLFVVILATIIQKLPVKVNPWTYLFQLMGRTANADIIKRQEKLEKMFANSCTNMNKKISQIEQGLNKACDEIYEYRAIEARRRILQFANEVSRGLGHSEEYFDDILKDIDNYTEYCNNHENFKNEKAVASIAIVKEDYYKNLKNNSFLRKDVKPDCGY